MSKLKDLEIALLRNVNEFGVKAKITVEELDRKYLKNEEKKKKLFGNALLFLSAAISMERTYTLYNTIKNMSYLAMIKTIGGILFSEGLRAVLLLIFSNLFGPIVLPIACGSLAVFLLKKIFDKKFYENIAKEYEIEKERVIEQYTNLVKKVEV
ncbi:MAG: hypothetical protein WC002_09145 [Candidatus Muiribacteriota bacterium]